MPKKFDREPIAWITRGGKHIPIFEGDGGTKKVPKVGEKVKLKNPVDKDEAKLIFVVKNVNEVTRRVYIQPINTGLSLPPQELVSFDDIKWIK